MHLDGPAGRRICLVVPCYNEARRLDVARFRDYLERSESVSILFVDDGSQDNTVEILGKIRQGREGCSAVLRYERNSGKAEAVRQGVLHALDNFAPSVVGFWDADLATPLESADQFLRVLDSFPNIEMVFGARVKLLGRHVERRAARHYLGRIFATAVSSLLGLPIYDTQCGAKVFRVKAETRSIFAEPFLSRWVFDVEILARYQRYFREHGMQAVDAIYEYPLETWVDVAGSKVHAGDFFVAFWDILRIRSKYLA